MVKFSFNSRVSVGKEFVEFLIQQNLQIDQLTVKHLEELYVYEFMPFKSESGVSSLPSFMTVLQPLQVTNRIKVTKGKIRLIPHGKDLASKTDDNKALQYIDKTGKLYEKCETCDVLCNSSVDMEQHVKGHRHKAAVKKLRERPSASNNKEVQNKTDDHNKSTHQPSPSSKTTTDSKPNDDELPPYTRKDGKNSRLYHCEICKVSCHSRLDLNAHVGGKLHKNSIKNLSSSSGASNTTNADNSRTKRSRGGGHRSTYYPTQLAVDQHLVINKPGRNDANAAPTEETLPRFIIRTDESYQCIACVVPCRTRRDMESHVQGKQHRTAEVMHGLQKRRDDLIENKGGVVIRSDHDLENGIIEVAVEEKVSVKIYIEIINTNTQKVVIFDQCEMLKRSRIFQLDDTEKVTESKNQKLLLPGSSYLICVQTKAHNVGSYHTPLSFRFKYPKSPTYFHIVRKLHARCHNSTINSLKPTNKYKRPPRRAMKQPASQIIDGLRLPSLSGDNMEKVLSVKPYPVPNSLRHIINRGLSNTKGLNASEILETTALRLMLEKDMTISTYNKRLSALMHCEEIQMEVDIRQFDMEDATMTICNEDKRLLVLKVPGLAENRPSILRGDELFVQIVDSDDDKEYKGHVHEVRRDEVLLGFHQSLFGKMTPLTKFSVRFTFSRLPVKLQHRACEFVHNHQKEYKTLLFPEHHGIGTVGLSLPLTTELKFYSSTPVNKEQACAIQHIVCGTSRPAPYLVFGPPGTGKTFTIVEAMKQVLTHHPSAHILACTPSNNAADLITQRLLDNQDILGGIIRLNAMTRNWRSVPDKIKAVCNYDKKTGTYFYPNKEVLQKYRVVVCTAVTGGRLSSASFPNGHFTHIFLDEAGHALESEALIPVINILNVGNGQLVLAGDQKQLGPILRSPFAIKYGLNMSLLERYMNQTVYSKIPTEVGVSQYNPNVLTKLVKNYRSHSAILHYPNQLFYEGELETNADPVIANMLCNWERLPNKNFPIIFHPMYGEEHREERSPSFFNPEEAYQVLQYVKELKKLKGMCQLDDTDIGIITPYQKQVQKIQKIMAQNRFRNIQVGSVEQFQGQERKVIIVSTVRSNPEYLSLDFNFRLGFLRNPKRFNVTVTRAKSLLIIIGNPNILSLDSTWSGFLEYIQSNGGCTESFDSQEAIFEDIIQRLKIVQLTDIDMETISHHNEQDWKRDV